MRGKLITFEGFDGAGKTTIVNKIYSTLKDLNVDCIKLHEPTSDPLYHRISEIALDGELRINSDSGALLFIAGRYHNFITNIKPALENGIHVIMDRFIESTIMYQASQSEFINPQYCYKLHKDLNIIQPDIAFLLEASLDTCITRIAGRKNTCIKKGQEEYDKISSRYYEISNATSRLNAKYITKINADKDVNTTYNDILKIIRVVLNIDQ